MALGQEIFLIYVKTEIEGEGNTTKAEEGVVDEVEEDATAEIEEGYVAKAEGCDTAKLEEDSATEVEDVTEAIECDNNETEEGATDETENGDTVATIAEGDNNEREEVYKGEKSDNENINKSQDIISHCPSRDDPPEDKEAFSVEMINEVKIQQEKVNQTVIIGLEEFSTPNFTTCGMSRISRSGTEQMNACPVGISPNSKMYGTVRRAEEETSQLKDCEVVIRGLDDFSPLNNKTGEDAVREDASDKDNFARIDVEKLRAAEHVAQNVCSDLAFVWTESRNPARDQLPTQSSLGNPGNCHPNISNNLHAGTCRNLPPDTSRNLETDTSRNLWPDTPKNVQADTSKNLQPDRSKNVHGDQNNDVRKCLHIENNLALDVLAGKKNDLVIVSAAHDEKLQTQISKNENNEIDHNNFSMNGVSENVSMNAALDKIVPTNLLLYKKDITKNALIDENNISVILPSCKGNLSIKSMSQNYDIAEDTPAEENNVVNSLCEDDNRLENSLACSAESDDSMRDSEVDSAVNPSSPQRNISRNTSINSLTSVSSFSDYDPDEAEDEGNEGNEGIVFKCGGQQNKLYQDEGEQVMAISLDTNSARISHKQINEKNDEFIAVDDDDTNMDNVKNTTISDKECINMKDNTDSTQNLISTNDKEKDQFVKDHKIEGEKLTALLDLLSTRDSYKKGSKADTSRRRSGQENNSSRGSSSEDERPKLKKCSSLKTCKSPTGKTNKKLVRFADSFGLEMRCVKTFKDDSVPTIPKSAYDDLDLSDISTPEPPPLKSPPQRRQITSLVPMFTQPSSSTNFSSLLQSRTVCLENAYIEGEEGNLTGTIRVLNLHFDKSVAVRWTTNDWQDVLDKEATYVHGASDGSTDRFGFSINPGGGLKLGDRLQFCLKYRTLGREFWDNNLGANYVFQVFLSHVNPMKGLDHSKTSNYSKERKGSLPKTDDEWGPCSY